MKTRRDLLNTSAMFFSIAFVLTAYAVFEPRVAAVALLASRFRLDFGAYSDIVFLVAAPLFLALMIIQIWVLVGILKRFAEARAASRQTVLAYFGITPLHSQAVPVHVDCREREEREVAVTVS